MQIEKGTTFSQINFVFTFRYRKKGNFGKMRQCNANWVFVIRLILFSFDVVFDVKLFDLIKLSVPRQR